MRRIALTGLITSAAIILTGEAVRLSQSGLGCPDWPTCTRASIVAAGVTGDPLIHRWVEFGNRLVTVAVFVVAVLVCVAAWQFRPDRAAGRRRDLVWLALLQPAAIAVQAVIGGLVVLTKLNPALVAVHYLASAALVAAALALWVRCQEGTGRARPLVRPEVRLLALGVIAVTTAMMAAGTVATGTGPLAGARSVPRFQLPFSGVTQLHADIGWLLGGLIVALVIALRLGSAPQRAVRLGWLLLVLTGVQGIIGYVQYFDKLPAGLVWVHTAPGATAIWITAVALPFALRDRGPVAAAGQPVPAPAGAIAQSGTQPGTLAAGPIPARTEAAAAADPATGPAAARADAQPQ
jgi:cytochrome c oxidase assembly protein subunit 15